jgi:hypothetical protein
LPPIRDGVITVYYLFDVGEQIDLRAIPRLVAGQTLPARLVPKPATPTYVQYREPPLLLDAEAVPTEGRGDITVRAKLYDFGVISLAMSRDYQGDWTTLLSLGAELIGANSLEPMARSCLDRLIGRLDAAIRQKRDSFLSEDYVVFTVTALDIAVPAAEMLEAHGDDIAHLLRGERAGLSRQERDEVLKHRLSYLESDLVIPTWNAAFLYDTPEGVPAAHEIIELANSQLLEFRYYDARLDSELERIYADLQKPRWYDVFGRRRTHAANQLHSLFIEVNELTDKMQNTLKLVGDVYSARLYALVAARLGLEQWKANVEEKLKTLDDIYRFAVEQLQVTRGHLLELIVVVILLVELVFFFLGIMR